MSKVPIVNLIYKLAVKDTTRPEYIVWQEFNAFIALGYLAYFIFWLIFGNLWIQLVLGGSLVLILIAIKLFWAGRRNLSILLSNLAYIASCLLVDGFVGWDFNSHYFLLCIFPLLAVRGLISARMRTLLYFTAASAYILGKLLMPLEAAYQPPRWVWEFVPTLNLILAILIIGISMLKFSQIMTDNEERLVEANRRMTHLANTDQLTGIFNRRYMYSVLEDEGWQRESSRQPYVIAIMDIDNFKQINDAFGHVAGDQILQETVQVILSLIRVGDVVARWGGEEFLVLLPNTDISIGMAVMERIRASLERKVYRVGEAEVRTTLTIGLADNHLRKPVDEIISQADECLYIGKREGKNRIVARR